MIIIMIIIIIIIIITIITTIIIMIIIINITGLSQNCFEEKRERRITQRTEKQVEA